MTFPMVAVLVTLLAGVGVAVSAEPVGRRMRPAQAVPLLTAAALSVSLAVGFALTAVAVAAVAGLSSVAADGHWSATALRAEMSVPRWLGGLAALSVSVLLARAIIRTSRIALALVRADRLCRTMTRAGGGPIVLVDDHSADAFTVAGVHGCVVISRRLFVELTADERHVLTAHELSHLAHRHHVFVQLADIAVAANPLLARVSRAVRFGVERWADEDAAAGTGDRRAAGRALARVALLRTTLGRVADRHRGIRCGTGTVSVLEAAALQVLPRVQALLRPAPQRWIVAPVLAAMLVLAVLIVGIASLHDIHEAIEAATPTWYR